MRIELDEKGETLKDRGKSEARKQMHFKGRNCRKYDNFTSPLGFSVVLQKLSWKEEVKRKIFATTQ